MSHAHAHLQLAAATSTNEAFNFISRDKIDLSSGCELLPPTWRCLECAQWRHVTWKSFNFCCLRKSYGRFTYESRTTGTRTCCDYRLNAEYISGSSSVKEEEVELETNTGEVREREEGKQSPIFRHQQVLSACLQHRTSCVSACAFQQARQQVRGRQELGVTLRTRNDSMPLLLTSDPTQIIAAKTLQKLIKLSCFLNAQILSVQINRDRSILLASNARFNCARTLF